MRRASRVVLALALASAALVHGGNSVVADAPPPTASPAQPAASRSPASTVTLPLAFMPNGGQTDARVKYLARAGGTSIFFTREEAVLALSGGTDKKSLALRLAFVGAEKDVTVEGRARQAGVVNYIRAGAQATSLATFGEVFYRGLWKGVDLGFTDGGGRLKYEFTVAPGASPDRVRLEYRGAERLRIADDGSLIIETALGTLRDGVPETYQVIDGRRVTVESRYRLTGKRSFGFALGEYDAGFPVVIDPGIEYSTLLGGSAGEAFGQHIAIDAGGYAYIASSTASVNFPLTVGAFDTTHNGQQDVYVAKLSPDGRALVYATLIGGTAEEWVHGIAIDASGFVYVAGQTWSTNFPTTATAFDTSHNSAPEQPDGFLFKLNPAGSTLAYSTYFGGSGEDFVSDVGVTPQGEAFIVGRTTSSDLPANRGDTSFNGGYDAFVAAFSTVGSLISSTFLGGSGADGALGVSVHPTWGAFVTGMTQSADFPTVNPLDDTYNGGGDVFVSRVSFAGNVEFSTFFGGAGVEEGEAIAVSVDEDIFVVGNTTSTDFPTLAAHQPTRNGSTDGFVFKLGASSYLHAVYDLDYSTYLNGNGFTLLQSVAVDGLNRAHIGGRSTSLNFPITPGAIDSITSAPSSEGTVVVMGPRGELLYSTFLGGTFNDYVSDVALDATGAIYATGFTQSPNFPVSSGAFDTTLGGPSDHFVTKFSIDLPHPASITVSPKSLTRAIFTNATLGTVVRDANGAPLAGVVVGIRDSNYSLSFGRCRTGMTGQCFDTYIEFEPGVDTIITWADIDADDVQDPDEPYDVATVTWLAPGTGALHGVVTNTATSAAVAGTAVGVFDAAGAAIGSAITSEDGRFAVNNLPDGFYFARTSGTADLIDELYDDIACETGCAVTSGTAISVGSGLATSIAFSLSPAAALEGVVRNAITNAPIASAQVNVFSSTGAPVANAVTDGNGFYRIDNLGNDLYRARTTNSAGFVDEVFDDISCALGCSITSGTPISTTAGETSFADFGLLPAGGGIAGKIENTATGEPIPGITAIVFDSVGAGVASAITNANGEYLTGDLPTGTYYVKTANTSGFIDELFDDVHCAVGCMVTNGTVVTHAAWQTGGYANFALDVGGRIRGRVTGEGVPLPNAPVHVYSGQTGALLFSAVTDSSGSYETPALPLGAYYARTGNAAGYANVGFENVDCALVCDPSTGTPIWVIPGAIATATFDLGPNTPVRESNFIIPELPNGTTPTGLMFFGLTAPGRTTVTASATGPALPSGYSLGDQPVFHTLQTTASFNVGAIVCFVYQGTNFDNLSAIKLLQHQGGAWNDITTSGSPGQHVCGITASLSQFVVVEQTGP
jgi:hypothetical protein